MKKHILVIAQYFYPEQFRINDICTEWVKRGYKVTVVTGIPNYPEGKYYKGYGLFKKRKETFNGINIIRIPLIPRGNNKLMLILNYFSFVISGFFWKTFTRINADRVFIFEVSPMTQALPGVWYAKRKEIPCYIYVQDLWPENIEIVAGIKNLVVLKMIGRMVDKIYKNCTKIFTTSNSFVNSIVDRGVPSDKVLCWPQYAEDFYKPLTKAKTNEIPADGAFNLIFAGNIGKAQGLDILVQAADSIRNRNTDINIRYNIVGNGRYKNSLNHLVKKMNLENVFNFIPKQPAARIPELLAVCDVAFLSLKNDPIFKMTIPAKLQTYMACGIPIIASADGEVMEIINNANAGMCSPSGDVDKLAENVISLEKTSEKQLVILGNNARCYTENNFNKSKLLNIMDIYLQ